jgi:pantothenate kinase type III
MGFWGNTKEEKIKKEIARKEEELKKEIARKEEKTAKENGRIEKENQRKEEELKRENERIEKENRRKEEQINQAIKDGILAYKLNSTIEELQKANFESLLKGNISEENKILIRQNEIIIRLLSKLLKICP